MAFLLPENIPSRNDISRRLQSVARAVRDHLPDEVTVWLREEKDEKGEAYRFLVLLDPAAGILVIEAPPERSRQAKRRKFKPEAEKVRRLVEENLAGRGQGAEVLRVTSLPVKNALALPDVNRGDALSSELAAAGRTVLFAEDLTASALREAIARILSHRGSALTGEQEKVARAAINPEIIIKRPVKDNQLIFRPSGEEDVLAVMDRQQERLAEHLGTGYRRIRGVAGSGKTLVLLHRARFIADHFSRRVLLLCFNKALETALQELVGDRENVTVSTVDGLAHQILPRAKKNSKRLGENDWERKRAEALKVARRLPAEERYHLVLVDEAQDLSKSHLDLAYEMVIKGPAEEMDFVVAFDSAQDIYRRKTLWNPLDMTARGRSTVMSVNYRNTREILEFAMNFLTGSSDWSKAQLNPEDDYALVPPEAARRTGSYPVVVECSDFQQEAREIADRVSERLDNGLRPDDVAVLVDKSLQQDLETAFNHKKIPCLPVSRDSVVSTKDKVRISNVYQVKGLEFPSVFIGGVNKVRLPGGEQDVDQIKSLLYVGMTRAQDELTVTFSGVGEVGEALRRAQVE